MITSKTGTSPIAWALNPLVPLYKPSPRKRPTLPLQNKFNQLLHASTTVSNSFNSCLESLSLQITQYLFNYSLSCPISYLSCVFSAISSATFLSFLILSAIFLPLLVLVPIITIATFSANNSILKNRTIFIHLPKPQLFQ